ncbi:expressed unknown protein [Seminavis robusta]|uniref:Uncharacterized protein n=1 Tax=Seminavis robusta TaxID=568900 RepID=A0A9N8DS71_9STRA|nr:expressed unknown protein [Seminavis robusta]|eukprot:Sro242_g096720.1 n/a (159) ;mRNA; f:80643-81119
MAMHSFFANLLPPNMEVTIEDDNLRGHEQPRAAPQLDCSSSRRPLATTRWQTSEVKKTTTKKSTLPPSPPRRRRKTVKEPSRWEEQESSPKDQSNRDAPIRPRRHSIPAPTSPKRGQTTLLAATTMSPQALKTLLIASSLSPTRASKSVVALHIASAA